MKVTSHPEWSIRFYQCLKSAVFSWKLEIFLTLGSWIQFYKWWLEAATIPAFIFGFYLPQVKWCCVYNKSFYLSKYSGIANSLPSFSYMKTKHLQQIKTGDEETDIQSAVRGKRNKKIDIWSELFPKLVIGLNVGFKSLKGINDVVFWAQVFLNSIGSIVMWNAWLNLSHYSWQGVFMYWLTNNCCSLAQVNCTSW